MRKTNLMRHLKSLESVIRESDKVMQNVAFSTLSYRIASARKNRARQICNRIVLKINLAALAAI